MHVIQAINKTFDDQGIYIARDKEDRYDVTFNGEELIITKNGMQFRIPLNDLKFTCLYKSNI